MLHKEDKTEMKKKRALRILSLILLCALTFTACKKNVGTPEDNAASKDENTEEKDKDEQESWKIGFSGIDMENPYFLTLESAIKEELDGKNCELIVKDPKTDPDMQASQIQEMIDEGINAIILSPVDWEKITPSLEALKEAWGRKLLNSCFRHWKPLEIFSKQSTWTKIKHNCHYVKTK